MQIQKDDIRKTILLVAREEFLAKGFKGASMRAIARQANVGLSNIYNYFDNKDEIFKEVLSPLLTALDKRMDDHNDPRFIDIEVFSSEAYMREMVDMFVQLIKVYKNELKILLFHAHGSELENFRNEYTDKHTEIGLEYIAQMKKKYPNINGNISNFFIHTMSS